MVPNPDQFGAAFSVFAKHLRNRHRDRAGAFTKMVHARLDEQRRFAQAEHIRTHGQVEVGFDPIHFRYALYRTDAETMGDDFIAAFHSLIRPFVGPITDSSKRELRTILGVQFQSVMKNRREELARIAASINRSEKLKSMILPMEQIYISSHTKYWDMMEVEIGKHNLQTETQSVLKAAPVPSVVTPHTGRGTKVVLLEECRKECERRSLPKGKTIRLDEKYSIATAIGMQGVPRVEKFKPGDKAYHRMSKMLSELGYCRKGASKFTD